MPNPYRQIVKSANFTSQRSFNRVLLKPALFEKIEFAFKEKKLNIFVEGAWLDIDGGYQLGRGILYFNDWVNLIISRFDPGTEKWSPLNESAIEPLEFF